MGSYYKILNIRLCLLHIVAIINAQIQFDIHLCNAYLSVGHINNIPLPVLADYCFFYVKTIICTDRFDFDPVEIKIERVKLMI